MLESQKRLVNYLNSVAKEIEAIEFSKEQNNNLKTSVNETELLIPIVGAFSAGKSSLINSFLGNEILPVGITPETSLATELRFSDIEHIEAVKEDESVDNYSITKIAEIKEKAREYKYLRLFLNNENLKSIAPLILVDMPGFNSPLDLHNQAIINYLNRGVHYIVLTSVEEGNITHSMVRQLLDINEFGREFSFFLSKSNLKPESEVNEIKNKIENQLEEYFNIAKNVIPIDDDGSKALMNVINTIEPERLFENLFIAELKNDYLSLIEKINTSISALKKDKTENENVIVELKNSIEKILQKRDKMLLEAKEKYTDIGINRIVDSVGQELSSSIEELVKTALSGNQEALSQKITEIVRHILISKVKGSMVEMSDNIVNDFADELKDINSTLSSFSMNENWLGSITDSTKKMFDSATNSLSSIVDNRKGKIDAGKLFKTITTVLAVTTTVLAPILEVVIIFLPDILSAIFGSIQKKKQEEQVRNDLLTTVIPSIKRGVRDKLPEIFNEQVNKLIKQISEQFEGVLQEKKDSISKIEEEKKGKINNIEQEILKFTDAKDQITNLANEVIFLKVS